MPAEHSPTDRPPSCYRLVVLGETPAGIAAAREAARRGVRVAFVTCEHAAAPACAPSTVETSPSTCLALAEQIRRVQACTGLVGLVELPGGPNVDLYRGRARFVSRRAVTVDGRAIRFRKAVIATGARLAPVDIEGAEQNGCLRPETLSELAELPRRLAVIGCGPEACQWAQAFRRLGSQVHLVGRATTVLPEEDSDAARAVQARLEQEEVRVHLRCEELTIETTGSLRSVVIQQDGRKEKLLVDRILVCGPRQPNTAGLDLETAAVLYTDRGIVIGDRMQTTNRHIFAAGDVCGPEYAAPQAAVTTAQLAVHNALSLVQRRLSRLVIPRCIYTTPQVARVGLTRAEAAARRIDVDTYRIDLAEADESIPPHRREGFIAVQVHHRTGRIVGATVVAEDADELIAPLQLLMIRKQSLATLVGMIPSRPSRLELLTRLAHRRASDRQSCLARLMSALLCPRSTPNPPGKPGD